MASHTLLHSAPEPSLALVPRSNSQIRRIFNNDQIIEKFDNWLLICGKSKNTRASYTLAAKQLAKFIINKPLTAITREDVRAFFGSLYSKGFAASTIQVRLEALRVFGDCLHLGGQVRVSVPRYILRRKVPDRLPHAKSEKEIQSLINAATTSRDRAILEVLYASGIRVNECTHLRCEDIDLRAKFLIVRQGKGSYDRFGLFGRRAAAALKDYFGQRISGPAFVRHLQRGGIHKRYDTWWATLGETDQQGNRVLRSNGQRLMRNIRLGGREIPNKERARRVLDAFILADKNRTILPEKPPARGLTTRQIYRVVVRAAKRAGISDVHPHTLRHSMATHCLNRGMDIRHVQELLGHASLRSTQQYLRLATANLQATHTKFFPR